LKRFVFLSVPLFGAVLDAARKGGYTYLEKSRMRVMGKVITAAEFNEKGECILTVIDDEEKRVQMTVDILSPGEA
jgi:hypothetical protein